VLSVRARLSRPRRRLPRAPECLGPVVQPPAHSPSYLEGVFSEVRRLYARLSTRAKLAHETIYTALDEPLPLPNQHEPRRSEKVQGQHHQRV
jgi:hypothetical protein